MTTEFRTTTKPVTLDSWYLHTDGTYGFYAGAARVGGPTMTHFAATAAECVKRDENGAVYEVGWPARGETTTYRDESHSRYENLRLIEAVIGRRCWDDDDGTVGGSIVSLYPDRASAQRDADRLSAQGLHVSVSSGSAGMPDEGKGFLWVVVGTEDE